MAPAVDMSTPFPRSHSTPDLLGGMHHSPSSNIGSLALNQSRALSLKSLPSLPAFDVPSFDLGDDFHASLRLGVDRNKLKLVPKPKTVEVATECPAASLAPSAQAAGLETTEQDKSSKRVSMIDRPRSWLPTSKSTPDVRILLREASPGPRKDHKLEIEPERERDLELPPRPFERSRTVESFAEFARRSWMSSSRSPSPPSSRADKGEKKSRRASLGGLKAKSGLGSRKPVENGVSVMDGAAGPKILRQNEADRAIEPNSSTSRALNRASTYLTRIKQSPQNVFSSRSSSNPPAAAPASGSAQNADSDHIPSTASSAGSATTSSVPNKATAAEKFTESLAPQNPLASSLPRNSSHTTASSAASDATGTSSETASQTTEDTGVTMPHPTSSDPLWGMFRTLDDEVPGFAVKNSAAARMHAVRMTLLPFLHGTAYHPSNTDKGLLTPEDVERRAAILSKWWNELLRMLEGTPNRPGLAATNYPGVELDSPTLLFTSGQQAVAGVDRPTLLEATTLIMRRPEWRMCTTYFQPLADRSPSERVRARSWTQSTTGGTSNPDMATILMESAEHNVRTMFTNNLVRQMAIAVDKMSQRHAPTSLVSWCGKACAYAFFFVPGIADVLVRLWALSTEQLGRIADELGLPKQNSGESEDIVALFPPSLGSLGWSSVKSIESKLRKATKLPLMTAKIPWHGPWVSRWRGADTDLLFIFAKYYYILADEFMPNELPLVERARAPAFALLHTQLLSTLDGTIHRQEALQAWALMESPEAMTLSLPGNNLLKEMDENRMVILLKDMLADSSIGPAISEAFSAVMRAAAKKVSIYDPNACCVMLDFFEQLLALKVKVDLRFWLQALKPILAQSQNTLSEIKLISFLYTVWDDIAADPEVKEAICCDWLLSEETWDKFFNNWCPLTRGYFMRLVCWRLCRDSGTANRLDNKIFQLVYQRLKTTWSHYLWLRNNAKFPPSTVPCLPAPSKRFIIIRSEVVQPQPGLLMSFDAFPNSVSEMASGNPLLFRDNLIGGGESSPTGSGKSDSNQSSSYRKKWTLLGKVLSMNAPGQGGLGAGASAGKRSWDEELEQARRETAASRSRSNSSGSGSGLFMTGPPPPPKTNGLISSSESDSSTGSSPIYDVAQYVFRFSLQPYNYQTKAIILSPPRLPAPAQARVSSARAALSNGKGLGRSDSPPPVPAGLPPATRRVSGLMNGGLVSEARNAKPLEAPTPVRGDKRPSQTLLRSFSGGSGDSFGSDDKTPFYTPPEEASADPFSTARSTPITGSSTPGSPFELVEVDFRSSQGAVQATKPTGFYATTATYTGRALAEWSVVVNENNSFVDRRRDEGVLGLASVEVPVLNMEGFGLRGARG